MNSLLIIVVVIVIIVVVISLVWLLRQSQLLKLSELSVREKLIAREAELANSVASVSKISEENESLSNDLHSLREEKVRLETSLKLERKQQEEKLAYLEESKTQLSIAFKNIANEIFEDKSKKFVDKNKESLSNVLSPLQEKISQFEKRVEETYDKESKERFSLTEQIKQLQELNNKISEDAINLTNALKGDNKAQGNWGELILGTLLENSGLMEGTQYEAQVNLESTEGAKLQPDAVIHLPESRDIIIDSKVSLKAWDKYCSAEDESEKSAALKQHIQSIRGHVNSLSGKDYQNLLGINSLDYVFLFMPIDAAYSVAVQNDLDLSQFAFEKNIVFVSPMMLLTTLKLVQNLWRLDQQNKNAVDIAEKAGALYDKFANFVGDLDEVGARIDSSKKSFDKAHNKLSSGKGNLIRRAKDLKELGAKTSKKLKHETDVKLEQEEPLQEFAEDGSENKAKDLAEKTRH